MYDYNCDVKLVVGSETFKAHRDVLVNASDYFSAMFTHDMRERQDDVIRLQDVSPRGFAAMIEYVPPCITSCFYFIMSERLNTDWNYIETSLGARFSVIENKPYPSHSSA